MNIILIAQISAHFQDTKETRKAVLNACSAGDFAFEASQFFEVSDPSRREARSE
jgi:hypothetical protein